MSYKTMFKKIKYFLATTALIGLAMSGCAKTDGSTTNPSPNELKPTGTVQGLLVDKVTQQPIVGAVVDIDGITATTNANGQFSLHNVPATTDGLNGTVSGDYGVTINLKNVTSPVKMVNKVSTTNCGTATAPTACYPEFAYDSVAVKYTSLDDTNGSNAGGGSGSNHDTPVTGLSATMNVSVGKLAAKITGVVGYDRTKLSVNEAGWTVKLVAYWGSNNAAAPATDPGVDAGTGASGNVVGTTTTDATGAFTFANIESLGYFRVEASNSAGTYRGTEYVTAPADDQTKTLSITGDPADTSDLRTVLVEVATSTIIGEVAYNSNSNPVPVGWNVKLFNSGNVVGSTTTDASGKFTFANVAANTGFTITVTSPDGKFSNTGYGASSPPFGETRSYTVQGGDAVYVASTDTVAPFVSSVSPENGSDNSPTGGINAVFTFSEPIQQNAYATTLTNNGVFAAASGLYNDIAVNYDGPKAGNIAHTLSWSADRKTLTVNIPTLAPASRYTVDISGAVGNLMDDSDLDLLAGAYTATSFTTNGAAAAAAPAVTLVNATSIDYTGVNPVLDWNPVPGAKGYNVYRAMNEVWGTTSNNGAYGFVDSSPTSDFEDTAIVDVDLDGATFVENGQTKLTYGYIVRSVNADGTESADSTPVTAADAVGPQITAATALTSNPTTVTLTFGEFLDEVTGETVGNFVWKDDAAGDTQTTPVAITITRAVYDLTTKTVALTLSGTLNSATVTQSYFINPTGTGATGVTPSLTSGDDTQSIAVGNGVPNTACVTENAAGTAATAKLGGSDDVQVIAVGDSTTVGVVIINSGANGICATTAAGETQAIAVGEGLPSQPVTVKAGSNLVLNTSAGTNTVVRAKAIEVSGVKDVAGNTIRITKDTVDTDGTIE
ncbi:MAG: hypothetical protein HZB32_05160 [Nitrospirae bacterium]|nr:hypothetical protein [Nitrospirota bacterium]